MIMHLPTGSMWHRWSTDLAAIATLGFMLMWAAVLNGFPLVFPDTGVYFGIIYGHDYAVDRSSFYGLLLKPVLSPLPTIAGLWLGILLQCVVVAAVVWAVTGRLVPNLSFLRALPFFAALALATSVAWHAGQYMPDAFTGPLVLTGWLASLRDPADDGAATLWLAAIVMALIHYTHIPLLLAVTLATIACSPASSGRLRSALRRGCAAIISVGVAAAILVVANGAVLGRWSIAPMGPAFLFARLTEDGLTKPWLRENCGKSAPIKLCEVREQISDDSQVLLWSGDSLYDSWIWYPPTESVRWAWIDSLSLANSGAISARPMSFVSNSLRGGISQFASFRTLDDLCPQACGDEKAGPAPTLKVHRPEAEAALRASRQVTGMMPVSLVRAVTTPVATLSLLLLPVLIYGAVRRNDWLMLSFLVAVLSALVANAMLAGALSDVNDRYQSRIIWIVPFAVVLVLARWSQTFSRSRISLPGLK